MNYFETIYDDNYINYINNIETIANHDYTPNVVDTNLETAKTAKTSTTEDTVADTKGLNDKVLLESGEGCFAEDCVAEESVEDSVAEDGVAEDGVEESVEDSVEDSVAEDAVEDSVENGVAEDGVADTNTKSLNDNLVDKASTTDTLNYFNRINTTNYDIDNRQDILDINLETIRLKKLDFKNQIKCYYETIVSDNLLDYQNKIEKINKECLDISNNFKKEYNICLNDIDGSPTKYKKKLLEYISNNNNNLNNYMKLKLKLKLKELNTKLIEIVNGIDEDTNCKLYW